MSSVYFVVKSIRKEFRTKLISEQLTDFFGRAYNKPAYTLVIFVEKRKHTYPLHIDEESRVRENQGDKAPRAEGRELSLQLLSIMSEVGISIAVPLLVGTIGGYVIDREFGSRPIGTLSGITIGFVLSFVNLAYVVKKVSQDGNKN